MVIADGVEVAAVIEVMDEDVGVEGVAQACPPEDPVVTKSRRTLADDPWVASQLTLLLASRVGDCTPCHGGV